MKSIARVDPAKFPGIAKLTPLEMNNLHFKRRGHHSPLPQPKQSSSASAGKK